MDTDFLSSIEPYISILIIVHIIISLFLSIILTLYAAKRFQTSSEEIDKRDQARLDEISEHSRIFKALFRVSLHKNNKITSTLFLFLFNLSLPVVGYPLSTWIAIYLRKVTYDKKVTNTNILNLDEFGMSFLKVERIFGEGSMMNLMSNPYSAKSKKLKALSSLATSTSPANLRIVKQTLSSTDDEIRMFGYAIINKTEKGLNTKINSHLKSYNESNSNNAKDAESMAQSATELAFLYWEMIYTELSHESLRDSFLNEVIFYIGIAKKYYVLELQNSETKNGEKNFNAVLVRLYVLMGRVYTMQKKYEKALTEFTVAQELSSDDASFILPYLAEIYFLTGNYKVVNSIIKQASDLGMNATLYSIVQQWKVV